MQYGHFDDAAREYVITTPFTPLPWINYLGSEEFFGIISNTGGGYTFYRDAKLQRIIRYRYNQPGGDVGGRFVYIKEKDKAAWSPSYLPCKTMLDSYECRHGMGYTVFNSSKDGLSAVDTRTVPMGENCELWNIVLTNNSDQAKELSLYGAVEWCLWNAVDDNSNFQRNLNIAEMEIGDSIIYHKTEYRERRDHYAYFAVNTKTDGYDTDRDTFLGRMNTWTTPVCVAHNENGNSLARGWFPIACHRIDMVLQPGESKEMTFILGYGKNPRDQKFVSPGVIRKTDAERVTAKYADNAAFAAEMDKLRAHWDELLGIYTVESDKPEMNRMVNIWNQYQCMATFCMSRSASYYESGMGRGMGFRDSCQDLLGFVHLIPASARERIIDIASIQWESGKTYHQYQPLTKRGNNEAGSGFNDDPLWLIACTCAYIRETGDDSILNAPVPFDNVEGSEVPLMEHLRRSINYILTNRGPHGLPLIGRADWNDCLNLNCFSEEPGESFQTCANFESGIAESVFIGGMFVKYAREFAELCERYGDAAEGAEARKAADEMEKAIIEHGWDGEWFLRAYDAYGNKVGSEDCDEGKIYIEPQGFCSLAGVGKDQGLVEKALDSVRDKLAFEFGIELIAPRYTVYHKELGEITSYPPGYKENGSVFCHNNPWVSIAETVIGRGDNAFDYYKRICPAYLESKSDIHKTEPYVYSQTVAGRDAALPGEAKNSWLTGTAAWTFVNISQYILGIQPDFDGLRVNPCIPADLKTYTVRRKYRGCMYEITVTNNGGKDAKVKVNGEAIEGNLLPVCADATCKVEVEL